MKIKRRIANFFIIYCGLRHLHNSSLQRLVRAVLDEIDLQHLRDKYPCQKFDDRKEMYHYINSFIIKSKPIDFLEFGVFCGESMSHWTSFNRNKNSRFYGFDSFQGLPDKWREGMDKEHFTTGGVIPEIDDQRVEFIKGWFDKTVPDFMQGFIPQHKLVIHLDADMYESTLIPLIYLNNYMSKGDLLIFDEFYDRNHEFKAFNDFLKISKKEFRIISEMMNYGRVCIELI